MNKQLITLIRLSVFLILLIIVGCKISSPITTNKNIVSNDSTLNYSLITNEFLTSNANPISIKWVEKLNGEFEFTKIWSYKEGIYRNSFGQLSCDGFCPERIDKMKDSKGKILKDSLIVFYQLIDTTHIFHNLNSIIDNEEKSYVNFINTSQVNESVFTLFTIQNSHIYGSLKIMLINSKCFSEIVVISPNPVVGMVCYKLKTGNIYIESEAFKKGIIKSKFDFTFELDNQSQIEWKGFINVTIE